jgi:FkbM family methyltransferase
MTEYKRKGNKWTINELLQLQREYELLEWTVQQIAEKHQRSVTAILYRLEDEGFVNSFSNARGYNINLSEHYTSSFTSEIVLTPGDECGGDECGGDDDNYEYLCEDDDNSESNVNNVENYKVGLGENNTHKIISIPKNNTNCGQYSIVDFTNFQNELIDEKIEIKCLDDFNLTADLIKIDTQGYELPILRGSIETLKKNFPVLILELENKKDLKEVELKLISTCKNPIAKIILKKISKEDPCLSLNQNSQIKQDLDRIKALCIRASPKN